MSNLQEMHSEIVLLKADSNYTIFFLANGKQHVSSYNLKKHEENIELQNFIRINRGHLINPKHIISTDTNDKVTSVRMSNGMETKVARRRSLFAKCD
jgi:two-component system, LytTR family, response regulator